MEFYQYLAPTKVIFGCGTEARTGALCKETEQQRYSFTTAGTAPKSPA